MYAREPTTSELRFPFFGHPVVLFCSLTEKGDCPRMPPHCESQQVVSGKWGGFKGAPRGSAGVPKAIWRNSVD